MSLFIGKDNSGNALVHMTNSTNTITELKSGKLNTTIFHSSLDYLEFTKYNCSVLGSGAISDTYGAFAQWNFPTYFRGASIVTLPTDAISMLSSGYAFFFVGDNTKLIPGHINTVSATYPTFVGSRYFNDLTATEFLANPQSLYNGRWVSSPTLTYNRYVVLGDFSSIDVYILNIKSLGYIKNPNYNSSEGIHLVNSGIIVNNINISTYKYISNVAVNGVDTIASLGTLTLQFINSNTTTGVFSLDTTSLSMSIGGKNIFSPVLSNSSLFKISLVTINLPSIIANYSVPTDIDTGINIGIYNMAIIYESSIDSISALAGLLIPDGFNLPGFGYLLFVPASPSIAMQTAELIYKSDGKLYYRTLSRTNGAYSYTIPSRTLKLLLFN